MGLFGSKRPNRTTMEATWEVQPWTGSVRFDPSLQTAAELAGAQLVMSPPAQPDNRPQPQTSDKPQTGDDQSHVVAA